MPYLRRLKAAVVHTRGAHCCPELGDCGTTGSGNNLATHDVVGTGTRNAHTSAASIDDAAAVPVVDVSPFLSYRQFEPLGGSWTSAAADAVVHAIGNACRDFGFVVVTGHGIDPNLTKKCADEAAAFFNQTEDAKLTVAAKGGAFGYIPLNSEALGDDGDATSRPDLREAFAMGPVENLRPNLDLANLSAHEREVTCPDDGLIVNVGDLMTRWTNGRWLSTPHRVRVPRTSEHSADSGRLSIAWFQNLSWDAEISNLFAGEEANFPPITQGELFWQREGPQRPGRRTDAE